MRAWLVLLAVLAAGCTGGPADAPSLTPTTTSTPHAVGDPCPRVSISADPGELRWGARVAFLVSTTACETEVEFARPPTCEDLARATALEIHDAGAVFYLTQGERAFEEPRTHECPEGEVLAPPPRVPAGTTTFEEYVWDGTLGIACEPDPSCLGGFARYAATGEHPIGVVRNLSNGTVLRATLVLPVRAGAPPPVVDGAVRLVLPDSAAEGTRIEVAAENRGDTRVTFNPRYAACSFQFYREDGRRFLIPPGTHCDLVEQGAIEPGATAKLFEWDLAECLRDTWGCAESAPLPQATYYLRWTYYREGWDQHEPLGTAGASIRVE